MAGRGVSGRHRRPGRALVPEVAVAPTSLTLVLDAAGRYFVSFVVRSGAETLPVLDTKVGVDLGLTHFAVMSDGAKVVAPKFLRRAAKKIRREARDFSPKSVSDASWGGFLTMLEYKAARYGRAFGKVDRWFPSTRMCSVCGRVGDKLDLSVRSWTCLCGVVHDRDINAAINILAAGRADSSDRGACVRPVLPAAGVEAVTHREPAPCGA